MAFVIAFVPPSRHTNGSEVEAEVGRMTCFLKWPNSRDYIRHPAFKRSDTNEGEIIPFLTNAFECSFRIQL